MDNPLTPQDKAINHSLPIQCYEIWDYEGVIHGSIIDWKPAWKAIKDYEVVYDIKGKAAHFVLVTNDLSILRAEAINFAKAIYENKVRNINIDLSYWNDWEKQQR